MWWFIELLMKCFSSIDSNILGANYDDFSYSAMSDSDTVEMQFNPLIGHIGE